MRINSKYLIMRINSKYFIVCNHSKYRKERPVFDAGTLPAWPAMLRHMSGWLPEVVRGEMPHYLYRRPSPSFIPPLTLTLTQSSSTLNLSNLHNPHNLQQQWFPSAALFPHPPSPSGRALQTTL